MKNTLCIATGRFPVYFIFPLVLFFTSFKANAAAIASTAAGGNWSAGATWVGGVVPGVGDNVTIVSGSAVTVDITTAACATLNINTGTTGGGAAATLTFTSGNILTVGGLVTIGATGAGRTGSINMTAGGTLIAQQFTVTRAGTWTPGTGTIQLSATNTLPGTFFTTFNNLAISAGTTTTGRALTINSNLTIADGATFTAAGFALTVTGTTTIGNGASGTLNISAAAGAKVFVGLITLNTGGVWNNSGNSAITVRGGITNNGTLTSGTGVYTFNTNSQALTGTLTIASMTVTGAAVVVTNNNTLTIGTALTGTGGLTQAGGATLNIGGTSTITTLTATALTNTVNYTGTAQTVKATNYDNLTLSGTGADLLPNAVSTLAGDLTLSGAVTATTRAGLTINGNLIIGDGTTFTAAGFALTVAGTTTIGSGTSGILNITAAAGTKIFGGLIRTNAGAVWNNSGNSPITVESGITHSGATFTSGTGVYTFSTSDQALNPTTALTINNVTVTGITLTNKNTLTVSTNLIGSGTLLQGSSASVLNIGGTATITGMDATTNAGNTVNYTGAAQTVNGTNYSNLIFSGSGAKTLQAGTTSVGGNLTLSGTATTTTVVGLTISGNLSVGDGTTFTGAGFPLTVSGTTIIGAGTSGRITINNAAGTKTFAGLITVNTGGTWANTGNSPITVQKGITNSGTFTSGTGVYTFSTNAQALTGTFAINNVTVTGITLTNNNTLTVSTALSGTGTLLQAAAATLNIGGSSLITGLDATTNINNTVNYTGVAQTINPTNYYHLTFSGSGVKTMQTGTTSIAGNFTLAGTARATVVVAAITIGGNFVLGAGTRFTSGAFTHSVGGNWTNNGTTFTPGTGTINFNGTAASQTIGGTAATTFSNLTINNTSLAGFVSLNDGTNSANKTVTGVLTLTSGYLTTTSSNLLILNNGSSTSVANAVAGVPQSNSPYVNGPMNKVGNTAFIFPVGSSSNGCVPIGISAPATAAATFQAQYNRSSAKALGGITAANLYNVSICEYWTLNRTVGASTVSVTAYWNANNPCNGESAGQYVSDLATLALAHFNGTSWDNSTPIPAVTNGTISNGSVTWLGVTTFSPFALGNNNISQFNPLEIKLDYFTAVKANGYNILSWKAECTTSSNLFEAQRSSDGVHFSSIDSVNVNAASDCSQAFVYNDYSSTGDKIYYRIKATDASGNVSYSFIELLINQASAIDMISVNPNPVQGDAALKISSLQNDHVDLVIFGIDGKELLRRTVQVPIGTSIINLQTSGLPKGLYIVKGVFSGGQTNTIKFVKQ